MSHEVSLLKELTSLTKTLGYFNTNYGLCNENYISFIPIIIPNPNKMNELSAINKSIPSLNLDLSCLILQFSHEYYTTSDFMNLLISHFNANPDSIPRDMSDYHESTEFQNQFQNVDLRAEAKAVGIKGSVYDSLHKVLKYTDKQILTFINRRKESQIAKQRQNELEEKFKNPEVDIEAEAKTAGVDWMLGHYSDSEIVEEIISMDRTRRKYNTKQEEPKNIDGLKDFIQKMNESKDVLHFPLEFYHFGSRQVMHSMVTDHEDIIGEDQEWIEMIEEQPEEYDEFVKNVNMVKEVIKFMQNNTFNSKIYSIPSGPDYWDNPGSKYYGTVFVIGETEKGNLFGFHFDQSISI